MKCDAFPEGVPNQFRFGSDGHVDPVEGDHGIQFELAPDLPESSRRLALRLVEAHRKWHQVEEWVAKAQRLLAPPGRGVPQKAPGGFAGG